MSRPLMIGGTRPTNMIPDSRIRAYRITSELVTGFLKGVSQPYATDLPADAKLVAVWWDPWSRTFYAQFHSMEFQEVIEGMPVPEHALRITYTDLRQLDAAE